MWIARVAPNASSNTFRSSVIAQRTTTSLVQKSPLPRLLLAMFPTAALLAGQGKEFNVYVQYVNVDTMVEIMFLNPAVTVIVRQGEPVIYGMEIGYLKTKDLPWGH